MADSTFALVNYQKVKLKTEVEIGVLAQILVYRKSQKSRLEIILSMIINLCPKTLIVYAKSSHSIETQV